MQSVSSWQRLVRHGRAIYIHPERPDWLVPNAAADTLLQRLIATNDVGLAACRRTDIGDDCMSRTVYELARLQPLLAGVEPTPYQGRAAHLELGELKECWFHLTDQCNLACGHCLFGASPGKRRALDRQLLQQGLDQAAALGCRLFYFTGGEPFVYPDFVDLLRCLLIDQRDSHVAVLTNGLLLTEHLTALKALPIDRLHLQVSLDGLENTHDAIRGPGTYQRLLVNLAALGQAGIHATLSVAVNRRNLTELSAIVELAGELGLAGIHLLWHFIRGKGRAADFVPPAEILPHLIEAQQRAVAVGVVIDNLEILKNQVFSTPGTIHDLSNTAWESLAVGPDGMIYPSPALVAVPELACGALDDGLETVWRQSPVLQKIRAASLVEDPAATTEPLRFIIGGGDIDHSYLAGNTFVGRDPYLKLYNEMALWLIAAQVEKYPSLASSSRPEILLRMGDVRFDCPEASGAVSLTHCNCLLSLADDRGHRPVREFYAQAALAANKDIVNPFAAGQAQAAFIPAAARQRSYGCGSPVKDADLQTGEIMVDLGSGSGVECFMAAEMVGRDGLVYGIDMTDEMLNLARASQDKVTARLGYDNVSFQKGFLEQIPLADNSADVVISNCVINLSPDKRTVFLEIFRVLKPGGRMVVSDVVTEQPVPVAIKNNELFRGECLGGALQQEELLSMLRGAGFKATQLHKRFPYRLEGGVQFYSLTFAATKPAVADAAQPGVEVIYRGPHGGVYTEDGALLLKGRKTMVAATIAARLDDAFFVLDGDGKVTNLAMENSCDCSPVIPDNVIPLTSLKPAASPTSAGTVPPAAPPNCCGGPAMIAVDQEQAPAQTMVVPFPVARVVNDAPIERFRSGCMVCGKEIIYHPDARKATCHFCGVVKRTNGLCVKDHFICDDCHQQDGLLAIKTLCTGATECDMLSLLRRIRQHPAISMHGPEHHAMVPGIILAVYRNLGGVMDSETILAGIERGGKVPGGVCGFWGNCGAAIGVGIAFSLLLQATPLTATSRQQAQQVTARVLSRVAQIKGARCCQRETVIALQEAARISKELLPVTLQAEDTMVCTQFEKNRECIRRQCPLWQR